MPSHIQNLHDNLRCQHCKPQIYQVTYLSSNRLETRHSIINGVTSLKSIYCFLRKTGLAPNQFLIQRNLYVLGRHEFGIYPVANVHVYYDFYCSPLCLGKLKVKVNYTVEFAMNSY